MSVLRANVDFAKRIFADRVGNDYVYGGNWRPDDLDVGTDCSGLVIDICDAVRNGPAMAWSRHGMSTESWRPIDVGETGTMFGTVCVADPSHFPPDAAVKIALHHGPGGGANSHMWCEVEGVRMESNGSDGCVTGSQAMSVYNTSYANDWHYLPGPIVGGSSAPAPLSKKDQYALTIINKGRAMGMTPRGITIALATALVESNITVYANSKVPASMAIPHDAVGSDGYSVGIFQQQVVWGQNGWWWSDAATCMDPASSAGLFYDRLRRLPYNGPNTPGSYAQQVQQSAYPRRYDERYGEAEQLYTRLVALPAPDLDPITELLMSDLQVESLSIYATPGEPLIPIVRMVQSIDAADHRQLVEDAARLGDVDSLQRIARTAAGQGKYKDPATVAHAKAVLADIEANTPNVLKSYLASKGQ